MKKIVLLFMAFIAALSVYADDLRFTVSGVVKDSKTGEELIGAAVFIEELKTGVTTNVYGFYSISLPQGKYSVKISYLGYETYQQKVELKGDMKINVELNIASNEIKEVEVKGEKTNKNVTNVEMSTNQLQMKTIQKIPALMGEVDVLKTIDLLPGVQNAGEGSTGFYVRGGGVDQNLILLDDATVYTAAHLGGLFSVFNQDAVKEIKLFKGGIPAEYGGRLSSLLDIRMKEGNSKKFAGTGGIGLLSSRLTLEGPILGERSSFVVSGRRTYFDLFFPYLNNDGIKDSKVYFYDLNTKLNYRINENNRIFISGYFGRDVMKFGKQFQMWYGNATLTARYNHIFNNRIFSNLTLIYSDFSYGLGNPSGATAFEWNSNIIDYSLKNDYTWYVTPGNTVKWGVSVIRHKFVPGSTKKGSSESIFNAFKLPDSYALESGAFISHEAKVADWLSVDYGIRFSLFQNMGSATYYKFDKTNPKKYAVKDSSIYKSGEIFNTYNGFEPRLALRFQLNENTSVKANYNHTIQYIHLASNTMSPTPLDIWFPSSPNVKPQSADQIALGIFKNLKDNMFETSVEVYYKKMHNTIDYKDHAELLVNKYFEGELRFGSAYSYGAEFLIKKQQGAFTGWLSYTYSKVFYNIPDINNGKEYPANYDRPHDFSLVLSYDITERFNISSNFVYTTGAPRTMPTGRFEYGGMVVPVYSDRNDIRLPDYHRMDLSLTYNFKDHKRNGKKRLMNQSLNISVYNVYNRHNAFGISFLQDEKDPNRTYAEKMYLFKIFPAITYNFNF